MGVFDGANKVPTRVELDGDKFAPMMGALTGSGFTEDVLNHGTLNQMVMGNVTRTFMSNETISILGSQTVTITGSQTQTITGSQTETVIGGITQTVIGSTMQTYIGGQITTCVGPHSRTDVSVSTWLCPSATMINSGDIMETKIQKMGAYGFRFTGVGVDVSIRMSKTDISVNATDVKAIETKLKTLQNKLLAGLKNRAAMLCLAMEMARSDIKGIHPEVRAARPAVGIELSVPPDTLPGIQ